MKKSSIKATKYYVLRFHHGLAVHMELRTWRQSKPKAQKLLCLTADLQQAVYTCLLRKRKS
jgi:hypothetical protein